MINKILRTSIVILIVLTLSSSIIPINAATVIVPLFEDGFESGDTSAWSSTNINTN
jgi:hypothetical protein